MSEIYKFSKFKQVNIFQNEIIHFLAVCESLNISKSSELLGIQQSGLSRSIKRLEINLGQKLFIRKNNGLMLSESGTQFLAAVKNAQSSWEISFKNILAHLDQDANLIKIGLHPSFGQSYLPEIIKKLSSKFPNTEIEVYPLQSFQITRKILEGQIDFGIVTSPTKQPELISKTIGQDFLAVYKLNPHLKSTFIIYNPETRNANDLLEKFKMYKKIIIKDYDLIAEAGLSSDNLVLLPYSVAKNYPKLQQVGNKLLKANISLICMVDKPKTKTYKNIYNEILSTCLKFIN
jgi:DNA-binding transcriptional LysR family regulator